MGTTIEVGGSRNHLNYTNTILEWGSRNSWWYEFKWCHLYLFNIQEKGLEVYKTQGLIQQSCQTFYKKLKFFYNRNNYLTNQIWNSDEARIQGGKKIGASMLAKCGS